jgi:tetratricopeptide (TPR) repeat protein
LSINATTLFIILNDCFSKFNVNCILIKLSYFLSFFLLSFSTIGQEVSRKDSIEKFIYDYTQKKVIRGKLDTVLINAYDKMWELNFRNDYTKAYHAASNMIALCEPFNHYKLALSYMYAGISLSDLGEFGKAVQLCEKSIELSKKFNRKNQIAEAANTLGIIFSKLGNHLKALEYYQYSKKISYELKDFYNIGCAEMNIGILYKNQKQFEYSRESYLNAISNFAKANNDFGKGVTLCNLAELFNNTNEPDSAIKYGSIALSLARIQNEYFLYKGGYNALGKAFSTKNEMILANAYLDSTLRVNMESADSLGIISTSIETARVMHKIKKYDESLKIAKRALNMALRLNVPDYQRDAYLILSQVYDLTGKSSLAFESFKQYTQIKDSLFTEDKNRKLTELNLNFKFKQELDSLNSQQMLAMALVKSDNNRKQSIMIVVSGASIILILVLITLIIQRKQISDFTKRESY